MEESVVSVKKYYYQPEIARSIVYWSYAIGLVCLGIIMLLEKWGFSWVAILIGLMGLFFVYYGLNRYVIIQEHDLFFYQSLKKARKQYPIKAIEKVSLGTNGLTLLIDGVEVVILLKKKKLVAFISELEKHPEFTAKIMCIKKSEG